MSIQLAQAEQVLAAAHAKAAELGLKITAVVVDAAGLPVALGRMDGAMALSTAIAEGKAVGAAVLARDGDAIATMNEQRPAFFQAISQMARVPLVPGLGSLAIRQDGALVGAIGVSGAKPEEDLECARAGLAALESV